MTKILIAVAMPDRLDKRDEVRHIILVGMCDFVKENRHVALSIAEFLGEKKAELAKILLADIVSITYAPMSMEMDDSMYIPFGFVDINDDFHPEDVAGYIVEQLKDFEERARIIMRAYKRPVEEES